MHQIAAEKEERYIRVGTTPFMDNETGNLLRRGRLDTMLEKGGEARGKLK